MVCKDGKKAVTHYRVVKETDSYSELKIKLETGRTHQIRVHLSYLGHPLVGDDLYGGESGKINRQALHCTELQLNHPFLNKNIELTAALPSDMARILV